EAAGCQDHAHASNVGGFPSWSVDVQVLSANLGPNLHVPDFPTHGMNPLRRTEDGGLAHFDILPIVPVDGNPGDHGTDALEDAAKLTDGFNLANDGCVHGRLLTG